MKRAPQTSFDTIAAKSPYPVPEGTPLRVSNLCIFYVNSYIMLASTCCASSQFRSRAYTAVNPRVSAMLWLKLGLCVI